MTSLVSLLARLDIRATLSQMIGRFPFPTLFALSSAFFWMYAVNGDIDAEWIEKGIITSSVLFFFATGLTLLLEGAKQVRYARLGSGAILAVFGILFYLSLGGLYDMDVEMITYILLTLSGFIAAIFVSPYLIGYIQKRGGEKDIYFYNYFTLVSWTFLMSAVVGLAMMILGFIAIGSVFSLFEIESLLDQEKFMQNWTIISLSLVAPFYGLIHLPVRSEYEKTAFLENRFFSFLVRYIATPFIYIYFIILYAYTVKVLLNFSDWPKGIISWMVVGFSSFGYLIFIFSRAYEGTSSMISLFRKYFPYLVIPQIGMLFYAIYLRIAQYDFTMNRYFVVVFGIWLLVISLGLIFSKPQKLSIIPASLVTIILIISIGPWSVYEFPLARQYDRLIANLEQANILKGNIITPLASPKDITKELSNEIYSGIDYVCSFDSCDRIKSLFPEEAESTRIKSEAEWKKWNTSSKSEYRGPSRWEIVSAVTEKIKVQSSYGYDENTTSPYIFYNVFSNKGTPYPLEIPSGYTQIVDVVGSGNTLEKSYPYIELNPDTEKLRYHQATGTYIEMSYTIPTHLDNQTTPSGLDQSDLTFSLTGETVDIILYLQSLAVRNPDYTDDMTVSVGEKGYYSISGIGLVKEKK